MNANRQRPKNIANTILPKELPPLLPLPILFIVAFSFLIFDIFILTEIPLKINKIFVVK